MLDEFGRAPDVFIRAGASRASIVLFALVVALAPAAILVAIEAIVGYAVNERTRRWLHIAFVSVLVLLLALHALRSLFDWQGTVLLLAALAVAGALAFAFSRSSTVRDWLRWLAVLPVIVLVMFLVTSPVSDLVRGGSEPTLASVTVKTHRNVVVLLLDEFPELSLLDANGHIDAHRLPNFAKLASESTWFRNATAVGTHTWFAMPAVMTGRYPPAHPAGAPTYVDYPDSIFRLLGSEYPANVSEVETRLCAPSYCHAASATAGGRTTTKAAHAGVGTLLSRARGQYAQMVALHDSSRLAEGDAVEDVGTGSDDSTTTTQPTPSNTKITIPPSQRVAAYGALQPASQPGRFTDWLAGINAKEPPSLNLIHLLLPHYPWLHTASGLTYAAPDSAGDGFFAGVWKNATVADIGRRQHLLQVGYVDRLLGTLVAKLKAAHQWDNTVLVVTADHGVAFTPGGHLRELDDVNRAQILGVPLFVHAPGMKPGIDDRPAQNIDALPTIASLLGAKIPWKVDGRDLSQPATPRPASHPVAMGDDVKPTVHVRSVDVSGQLAALLELAREHAVPYASPDSDLSVLRSGPHGALIGKPLTDFATNGDAGDRHWHLDFPGTSAFANVNVNGSIPADVTGTLDDARADDAVVASVNGRVAGVGVMNGSGDAHFDVLLDPSYFVAGKNDVRFFVRVDDHTLAPA